MTDVGSGIAIRRLEKENAALRAEVERMLADVAKARREGRIEGACCAINDLMDWSEDHVIAQAQDCVYNRWPEDKP